MTRVCIIQKSRDRVSETFIHAHAERIPGVAGVVYLDGNLPAINGHPVLSQSVVARLARKSLRFINRSNWNREITLGFVGAIRRSRADVVLAEYGVIGTRAMPACLETGVPLVVHFHGYDASICSVLEEYREPYRELFRQAAAVIAVSRAMQRVLLSMGCPAEKLVYNPYGIDCSRFKGATPERVNPILVAVGRLVEKKAPYLTLLAFARVFEAYPEARLRFIGDGPCLPICQDLTEALGIKDAVEFLGAQPPERVQSELQGARAFVQHSVTARNGDSEGTPLAVLEAGATGLPVIATRHAGISDVIREGVTGLLVDERDVESMAECMVKLVRDPVRAGEMGRAAANHVRAFYAQEQSIERLHRVLHAAARRESLDPARESIERELATTGSVDSQTSVSDPASTRSEILLGPDSPA